MVSRPHHVWIVLGLFGLSTGVVESKAQPNTSDAPLVTQQTPKELQKPSVLTPRVESEPAQHPFEKARALSVKILTSDHPRVKQSAQHARRREQSRFRGIPLTRPLPFTFAKTTSCSIFLSNLNHKLNAMKTRYESAPKRPDVMGGYASQLYTRGQIMGDLEEIARALTLVEDALKLSPLAFKLHLLRAQIASTLHRVDITRQELSWARARLKSPPYPPVTLQSQLETMGVELDLETGTRVAQHLSVMERDYKKLDFKGFVRAARARELKGQVTIAQRYYGQAERHFRDVAPIPIAWLNVQRGLMAMHSGDFKSAHIFFLAAYERCPQYPMATEHLAEIEGRLGHFKRAFELYEAVIKQTQNPEFMAALAELYLERGRESEARALIKQARLRFDELARRFPEAMSGHAADFYLGLGEGEARGIELLQHNYKLRPNARAAQALADALLGAKRVREAAPLVAQSLKSPVEFAEKYWTAARLAFAEGDLERAERHRARALKLNPRITEFEDELTPPPHITP